MVKHMLISLLFTIMETLMHIERIRDYGNSSFFPVFGADVDEEIIEGYGGAFFLGF